MCGQIDPVNEGSVVDFATNDQLVYGTNPDSPDFDQ
jgi:hypothetical protein